MATFNERMAKAFQDEGHLVQIITFSLQYPSILFPGKTQYSDDKPPQNLNIKVLINSVNPFSWIKTARYINQQKPDVVIFRYWMPFMSPCLGTIARLISQKIEKIALCDNIIPHEKFPFTNSLTQYFLNAIDKGIVLSKAVEKDFLKFAPNKKVITLNHPLYDNFGSLIDTQQAKKILQLNPQKKYILFFGFIRAYKGLDLLLQAFAKTNIDKTNINLLVAGEFYDKPDAYLKLIKTLEIEKNVVLHTHFIDNDNVKLYFSAADLVAQTYRNATQSGVSQIAFHFNKPILVTNVGGLNEIVQHQHTGYLVEPNTEDIKLAIEHFFDTTANHNYTENINTKKQEYSWKMFINNILNI